MKKHHQKGIGEGPLRIIIKSVGEKIISNDILTTFTISFTKERIDNILLMSLTKNITKKEFSEEN